MSARALRVPGEHRTKPEGEGTGLGLSVTRTIADAHGGELGFDFAERGGTVAILWFRAAAGERGS